MNQAAGGKIAFGKYGKDWVYCMCGRYVGLDSIAEIEDVVRMADQNLYGLTGGDICPSQDAVVITGRKQELNAEKMVWGFPQYQNKGLLINARAESVLERKMFRESVLRRHCRC